MIEITCPVCGQKAMKENSAVNRARSINANIYCSRVCSGIGRRNNKTVQQKKEEKRLYDIEYRANNRERLLADKKAWSKSRDKEALRVYRKSRMHKHVEYCRQPEYRAKKIGYDRVYRAKKLFGEFWEAHLLLVDTENEIASRITKVEIRLLNGIQNKTQERKREYERRNKGS